MKRIILAFILVLMVFFVIGCQENSTLILSPEEVVKKIQAENTFTPELQSIDASLFEKYVGVDGGDVDSFYMLLDTSRASCEQIMAIKAKDGVDMSKIEQAVKDYLETLKAQYRDYVPEEVPKIEHAVIETKGNMLIAVVGENEESIQKTVNELGK